MGFLGLTPAVQIGGAAALGGLRRATVRLILERHIQN